MDETIVLGLNILILSFLEFVSCFTGGGFRGNFGCLHMFVSR